MRRLEVGVGADVGREEALKSVAATLKTVPDEVEARVAALVDERKALERELAEAKKALALGGGGGAAPQADEEVAGVKFSGQVLPNISKVVYQIDIKRVMRSKLVLGIADGWLSADGETIYRAKDLRVGLFKQDAAA